MNAVADLSVVMPTYNHAQYLPRAFTALVTQSVVPREIIVVNDASTDETPAILEAYARDYPMVKVITNQENRRTNACVQIGLGQASGKYIYCVASDDYVLPGFVEKMVGTLEAHPQAGVCSAYFAVVNGVTGQISPNGSGWCTAPRYFAPHEFEKLIGHSSIPGHASILKRSSFDAAGGFLPDLEWHADWFMSLVVAFRDGICHVPEMLSLLTDMPQTYSSHGMRSEKQLKVLNAIFDRLASAEYADVAPSFRRSGALSVFGPPVIRTAAARADAWTQATLRLINGFRPDEYEVLLDDADPRVRELAAFFLGPFWPEVKARRQHETDERKNAEGAAVAAQQECAELRAAQTERESMLAESQARLVEMENQLAERDGRLCEAERAAAHLSERIRWMESSYFWKCRTLMRDCKHAALKPFGKAA